MMLLFILPWILPFPVQLVLLLANWFVSVYIGKAIGDALYNWWHKR